jgi:phosphohistidine phosphatase
MFLYVFRHGDAKPKSEDPERGLSDRGLEEVRAVCAAFSRTDPQIQEIWHSGKTRAEQTAGLLAAGLKIEGRVQGRSGLNPNDPLPPLVEELERREKNLVIVGHLPQLGKLISVLLLGAERELLDFPSAGLVCLERSADSWRLNWFLTPELVLPPAPNRH